MANAIVPFDLVQMAIEATKGTIAVATRRIVGNGVYEVHHCPTRSILWDIYWGIVLAAITLAGLTTVGILMLTTLIPDLQGPP